MIESVAPANTPECESNQLIIDICHMNSSPLIYTPKPRPQARVRLLCFSYAGGSSGTYIPWLKNLPEEVELAVVQLPGRGVRMADSPYDNMDTLVKDVFIALSKLPTKPCVFFGHSMGARVAYELTLMLVRHRYTLPLHVIASASSAPCVPRKKKPIYALPDDEFIAEVAGLNGSSEEVLADREIMELLMPTLRADFKIVETYLNKSQYIIPTTVSVFSGKDDDLENHEIEPWLSLFSSNTGIHWVDGDHFFVDKNRDGTLTMLNKVIGEYLVDAECQSL